MRLLLTICLSAFVLAGFSFATKAADSRIYIDVGQAKVKKSLVAFPPLQFYGSSKNKRDLQIGQELFKTAYNDLNVSALFSFIQPEAFLEDVSKVGLKPAPGAPNGFKFQNWKTIGAEFLVRGGYKMNGNEVNLEIYLYYVPQARLVFGKTYEGPRNAVRKIAHTFANDVVKNLTGKKGFFNTKIVVSSNRSKKGQKEIYVMDWDANNVKKISSHKSVAISPAWAPDGDRVAYTAYAYHPKAKTRNADLFIYQVSTGKRWLVSYRKGINSGAAFLPGGKQLLITLSLGGSPDIFKITPDGKIVKRLTNGPNSAMNVEPAVSHDGKKIAFSSDRSGQPMIYTMGIDGGKATRRTFAGKYNASPSWSPDGKKIAFAGHDKGHFDIFVMNEDGTDLKRLTSAKKRNGKWADNEDPTFSPDGRHIMFTSDRTGTKQLYIVTLDGSEERRITFDRNNYEKPKWSPFLD